MTTTISRLLGLGTVGLLMACGEPEPADNLDPVLKGQIEDALARFDADPRAFMDAMPQKIGAASPAFAADVVKSREFITAKNVGRQDGPADAPGSNDQAKNLVDSLALTALADMHSIRNVSLAESAWSSDYWGLYAGSIAKRYSDPSFPSSEDWKVLTDYVRNKQPVNPDDLSPAEKYDLLVGDPNKTLTKYNLDTGKPYYTSSGKVETWMGICHGWAPASFMVQRPTKVIEVLAADGKTKIKFYPADIKALASLLWAETDPATKFIGGRCNVKDPAKDANGRIKDQACRDTNAGTWHLAVVNQIGKSQRSMVIDATYDYEVWNQPMYGYSYSYFNPQTNKAYSTLSYAKVAVADYTADKFKAYRAPGTTHIVGVSMDVRWTVETYPSHATTDSATRDAISGARYLYTLELDSSGKILGGEWHQNAHPDFLWLSPPGTRALSSSEPTGTQPVWDGKAAVPSTWQTAARTASVYGQPLASVVESLVKIARQ
jgi:hypothetical protein